MKSEDFAANDLQFLLVALVGFGDCWLVANHFPCRGRSGTIEKIKSLADETVAHVISEKWRVIIPRFYLETSAVDLSGTVANEHVGG
jgi:hypothetical protein